MKGLPRLKFKVDGRLPEGEQPRLIGITRTPRRLNVCLVFQVEKDIPAPAKKSVGIDPGVKHLLSAVDEREEVIQIPGWTIPATGRQCLASGAGCSGSGTPP